jgi:GntR family transcriptional regulator, transcriptional repressor for pyruvate dehydrogenase complex
MELPESIKEPALHEASPFSPVRRVRSFDDIVVQIREAILTGQVRQGERLPGERELSQTFAVSRPTVREALRSLEATGVVQVRPGKGGGAFAIAPASSVVGDAVATLIRFRGASLRDLAEFRLSFEPENAWWAAQRADDDDIVDLRTLVDEARRVLRAEGSWEPMGEMDARWHEALARATKNNLRIGISQGIHDAVMHQVRALAPTASQYGADIPRDLARITKAVVAREPGKARDAMRVHVERFNRLGRELRDDSEQR